MKTATFIREAIELLAQARNAAPSEACAHGAGFLLDEAWVRRTDALLEPYGMFRRPPLDAS